MSDKPNEIPEADVMLGLPRAEWGWVLLRLDYLYHCTPGADGERLRRSTMHLRDQYRGQLAALRTKSD